MRIDLEPGSSLSRSMSEGQVMPGLRSFIFWAVIGSHRPMHLRTVGGDDRIGASPIRCYDAGQTDGGVG